MQRNFLRKGDRGAISHSGENPGQFGSPVSPVAPGGIKALRRGPGNPTNSAQAGFWARNPTLDPDAVAVVSRHLSDVPENELAGRLASIRSEHNLDNEEITDVHRCFGSSPALGNSYPPDIRPEIQDTLESTGVLGATVTLDDEPGQHRVRLPGGIMMFTRFNAAGEMSVKSGPHWLHPGVAWTQQELWDETVAMEVDGQATTRGFTQAPTEGVLYGAFDRHNGAAYFSWEDMRHQVHISASADGTVDFGTASIADRRALINAFASDPGELADVMPTVERIKANALAARALMISHPSTRALRRLHQG